MKKKGRYQNKQNLRFVHIDGIKYAYQWKYFLYELGLYVWIGRKKYSIEKLRDSVCTPQFAKTEIEMLLEKLRESNLPEHIKLKHHG